MNQGLRLWGPCHSRALVPSPIPFLSVAFPRAKQPCTLIAATLDSTNTQQQQPQQEELTARERRQLRNERRESKARYGWREEVEQRLIKKPKKKKPVSSGSVALNLDTLADLGPQWWIVRVSRIRSDETASLIARLLARNFPDIDFKVYAPAVHEKRKLKNGTYSVKSKAIFPGCVFLWCVLNRELHDFIRECNGVGGFVGSKVGNMKRQINRPRPVSAPDMEAIFQQAKMEQEKFDQAFKKNQEVDGALEFQNSGDNNLTKPASDDKPKRRTRKPSNPLVNGSTQIKEKKLLTRGSTVRVVSGNFAEFVGTLQKLNRKTGKATVGFTLFGRESLVDLDVNEIVAEIS
uniref:Uncharacterized protein MANES_08G083700 n=2 Tax=Rhizophora mucronata TaxID=61149 RepID=A0A2P2J7H7_RHIMU